MDKVAFVNKISTLMKATSDDSTPIQGYLYQEVNKITYESEGYCDSTLEFLVDRLNKPSCHVKFKVLKLMKYIIETGPAQFKSGLIRNSQGIRDATKFSAPDDPLHGNLPNKAVRKISQELSQLLFDTEDHKVISNSEDVKDQDRSRITGLGSTSTKGSMQGFGNSPTKTKSSFMDKLSRFASSFQDKSKDQQAEILASIESCGDYRPPPMPLSFTSNEGPEVQESENEQVKLVQHTPGRAAGGWDDPGNSPDHGDLSEQHVKHIPGKAGGGWGDDDDDSLDHGDDSEQHVKHIPGKAGGGWGDDDEDEEETSQSVSSEDGIKKLVSVETTESCEEEGTLIQSVLQKSEDLSLKEIRSFISECQAINSEKVVEMLNNQLNSSNQCFVKKCLLLIEYLIPSGLVSCDHICKTCQQQLLQLSKGEKTPSSHKASKILLSFEKLLDVRLLTSDGSAPNAQLLVMED